LSPAFAPSEHQRLFFSRSDKSERSTSHNEFMSGRPLDRDNDERKGEEEETGRSKFSWHDVHFLFTGSREVDQRILLNYPGFGHYCLEKKIIIDATPPLDKVSRWAIIGLFIGIVVTPLVAIYRNRYARHLLYAWDADVDFDRFVMEYLSQNKVFRINFYDDEKKFTAWLRDIDWPKRAFIIVPIPSGMPFEEFRNVIRNSETQNSIAEENRAGIVRFEDAGLKIPIWIDVVMLAVIVWLSRKEFRRSYRISRARMEWERTRRRMLGK